VERVKASGRFVLVGTGGVGGIVARMLAAYLYHEGRGATLVAVDGDVFEERNRGRQVFGRPGPKPIVLVEELAPLYGDRVHLVAVPEYLTPQRARLWIGEGDVVFCAPDNHATRRAVERRCRRLRDVALFSGGNDGVEEGSAGTFGNVQIYLRAGGRDRTNPLSRFHPEIERPRDRLPTRLGCQVRAARAPQLLFTNLAVAAAMLGAFYAWRRGELAFEEVYLDLLSGRALPIRRELAAGRRRYCSPSSSSSPSAAASPAPKRYWKPQPIDQ
jgi:hypothetical protein